MCSGLHLAILWVGLVACGRVQFTDEVRPDASFDASLSDARCDWSAGPPFTGVAVFRPELMMSDTEYDPFLVPGDPLTINFVARIGGSGELFEARRATTDVPFDAPVMRTDLSTQTYEESALALERGGLRGYYVSNVAGPTAIYEVTRASLGAPLQVSRELSELGGNGNLFDPWPFLDGLGLVYMEQPPAAANRILVARRATTSDLWSDLVEMPFSTSYPNVSGVTLTADGLVVVFAADGSTTKDIYYATRGSLAEPFTTPQLLEAANTMTNGEFEPSLRDDGCELFLVRDTGPGGKWDIYSLPAVAP